MSEIFEFSKIQNNINGWGPCDDPEQFKDLPYAPFSKSDRLGKVADWNGVVYQDRRYQYKYTPQFSNQNLYSYYHEEDESSFQLVDTSKVQKPIYQRGKVRFNQTKLKKEREKRQQAQANSQVLSKTQKSRERDRERQLRKWQKQFGRQQMEQMKKAPIRNASVQVKDSWVVVEEMDFPRLSKLALPNVGEPNDLLKCGSLEYYDKSYDRVMVKNERKLSRVNRIFHRVTTTDDPNIRQLSKKNGNVFATDSILAVLMCACRSVYSWDIVVSKVGKVLFFDKRDESDFDLPTVSETATEPPQDEGMNSQKNLALEATYINHNFSQQVLKMGEERYDFGNPNPFARGENPNDIASVAYKYRKWDLGNGIDLVCRCEQDCVAPGSGGENLFLNIKALNEWDSKSCGGVDWRSKLDTQRGAVLATELKNNNCRLAKCTVSSILAGSDFIKFGYVSRVHPKDSGKHVILGVQQFKPQEFAQQMNLNMENCWGILRCIIDICMKQKDGKYLLMKDPNKPMIRLYNIPNDSFESDNDDDDDSSNDEEEEEEEEEDEGEEQNKKEGAGGGAKKKEEGEDEASTAK